jgi:hypothetical protein
MLVRIHILLEGESIGADLKSYIEDPNTSNIRALPLIVN